MATTAVCWKSLYRVTSINNARDRIEKKFTLYKIRKSFFEGLIESFFVAIAGIADQSEDLLMAYCLGRKERVLSNGFKPKNKPAEKAVGVNVPRSQSTIAEGPFEMEDRFTLYQDLKLKNLKVFVPEPADRRILVSY